MGIMVEGKWDNDATPRTVKGAFQRPDSVFRNWITPDGAPGPSGTGGFKAEKGRYHLYVTHNCPWAYRTVLFRKLKGLEDVISIAIGGSQRKDEGWTWTNEEGTIPDAVNHIFRLHEVYTRANPTYTGSVSVPCLWDKERQTIVNNESSEIIRMFNSAFRGIVPETVDYYPEPLRAQIDEINAIVYPNVNNGVYRCGFATSQDAYEEAYDKLFDTLDMLDDRLSHQRYLVGERITEADWRLFSTLLRFDLVYYVNFKCNKKHIYEYPNLWNFTLELYQHPGVAEVTNLHHIKYGYFHLMDRLNPSGIVPKGPAIDFMQPHNRDRFKKAA
jgi:glutathionyl-hydroquinone reductase